MRKQPKKPLQLSPVVVRSLTTEALPVVEGGGTQPGGTKVGGMCWHPKA